MPWSHMALIDKFYGVPNLHGRMVVIMLLQELRQIRHGSTLLGDQIGSLKGQNDDGDGHSWRMMPGMALVKAPATKAEKGNSVPLEVSRAS